MSRRVITTQVDAAGGGTNIDTYSDRVIKYIPTDIVAAWVTVVGLIRSASDISSGTVLWITFAVGVVLAAAWTLKLTSLPGAPPAVIQTIIATGAFIVWVFALGGPFETLTFYRPVYGALLLIFY